MSNDDECRADRSLKLVSDAFARISGDLVQFSQAYGDLWEQPTGSDARQGDRRLEKLLSRLLDSCALFQPNPTIRRRSFGTIDAAQFLREVEYVVNYARKKGLLD